jgi:hypothetical protein
MTTSFRRGVIALLFLTGSVAARAGSQTTEPQAPASPYASLRRPTTTWSQADREIGFAHWDSIFRRATCRREGASAARRAPLAAFAPAPTTRPGSTDTSPNSTSPVSSSYKTGASDFERYGLGYDSTKRWTSQSVSKSITARSSARR